MPLAPSRLGAKMLAPSLRLAPMNRFLCRYTLVPFIVAALLHWANNRALAAADSVLVVNEIHYHPADSGGTEWVELHSLHGVNVDISGWKISGGIGYTFPANTTLAGHGYLIVAANPGDASLAGKGAVGPFTGALNNSGDTIRIVNNSGRVMDEVTYGDNNDWPVGPDGSGATLVKRDEESSDSGPAHWTSSPSIGGTPGGRNFSQPTDPPVVTNLVPMAGTWKYRDNNVAQPAGWTTAGFDDSAWLSGSALLYAGNPNLNGAGEGLLGYWPLEETTGTSAPNLANGGTVGTLNGSVTWVTDGTRGKVLNLPGAGGAYVDAGSIPQMTMSNDFTWSFWANSDAGSGTSVILGNRHAPTGDFNPLEFIKFTPNSFEFYRNNSQDGGLYSGMPTGTWVHHAVVKQGSNLSYYRNGTLTGTHAITLGLNNPQPFYFGGDKQGENWSGRLDDIATWTKALPSSSINALAAGTATPLTAATGSSSVPLTTQLSVGPTTHYFRRSFSFTGTPSRTTLTLQHILDDGAIFYLNGVEVLRVNMPGGTATHTTLATSNATSSGLSTVVTIPATSLVSGTNVLAVEVHQFAASAPNNDMVFGASLVATEAPGPARYPGSGLVLNEISASSDPQFKIELRNNGTTAIDLAGYKITSSSGASATLTSQNVPAGGLAVITEAQLGFTPVSGDKLFVFQPGGTVFEDAQQVTGKLRGRSAAKGGAWLYPSTASFGATNTFALNNDVVINELMYRPHPSAAAQEEWIELFNRGTSTANLAGWQFDDGISYTFPPGTTLAPGAYLVITSDTAAFAAHHAGFTALGPFSGTLASKGERVRLTDTTGNPVDELRYYDDGRWPDTAKGGGSSLERRDLRGDSSAPETWAASDESARGQWQTVTYSGSGANIGSDPTQWNEFVFGLLSKGSFLIDDISVKEDPTGAPIQLIQNQNFNTDAATWRLLGTHKHYSVAPDPSAPGNNVLRVDATSYTEHMHNHVETTLKSTSGYVSISSAKNYEISFRARWLSGNNALNTRLYFNRLARTTLLPVPVSGGTPGVANSRFIANAGPTYRGLTHFPAVPGVNQTATVSVTPSDPDGLGTLTLRYAVNAGTFATTAMTDPDGDGVFTGVIPGQAAGTKLQFYVQAADSLGATSFFPAAGAASRAIIPWSDGQSTNGPAANFRIAMLTAEADTMHSLTEVMSDDEVGATVIYRETEIYYDCGIRLKSSERGRSSDGRVGWHVRFPPHQPFLGAHQTVAIDRSGGGGSVSQKEILVGAVMMHAGNIPGSYDDLIRIIAPRSVHTGPATLQKARFSDENLDNQWIDGASGPMFEYELIYFPTTTNIPNTTTGWQEGLKVPQPDGTSGVNVTSFPTNAFGTNKELYRWHYLTKNNRVADDYSGIMATAAALGQSNGPQYRADTRLRLDIDQWLRTFALHHLFGIGDSYGTGGQHNAFFYTRPADGKTLFLPHDLDFIFSNATTTDIKTGGDLTKLVSDPPNLRAYFGHLLDLIQRSYNSSYLIPWAQHYNTYLSGEDLTSGTASYVDARVLDVQNQINSAIPSVAFAITTPNNEMVSGPFATIEGNGWVNVREIRLAGSTESLAVTWLDNKKFRVSVPVGPNSNTITLQAIGFDGNVLPNGTSTVTVVNTGSTQPASAANLTISKLMYHPAPPSASEQSAGYNFANAEDEFEWVEVLNISAVSVDLTGTHFTAGIEYTFPSRILAPGERLVVARNLSAFAVRYPNVPSGTRVGPFTSGKFADSGEVVTLTGAGGATIRSFNYLTVAPWPSAADGNGPGIALIKPEANPDYSLAKNWRHTAPLATPGLADTITYPAWKTTYAITDDLGDPDHDGITNYLEFVHGTDPDVPNGARVLSGLDAAGRLTISFSRRLGADELTFEPQTSSALAPAVWSADPAAFTYLGVAYNPEGTETVTYAVDPPTSTEPQRFLRIRAYR